MKYLVLVQARCGSTRLPNKVLADVCGKPDIEWVIKRVGRSRVIDEIIVVTSISKENLPLVKWCTENGIRVYVGSEDDVLDRYYQAAKLIGPEYVIRITADCPLFDWRFLDDAIQSYDKNADYLWMGENSFPDGLDFEIMTYGALEKAWKKARLQSEREHVTLYIRNHPEEFNIQVYDFPIKGAGHYRWTLDEDRDYELICHVYNFFTELGTQEFVTEDIIDYLKEHPEVEAINSRIGRNEGLAKSLMNDTILEARSERL